MSEANDEPNNGADAGGTGATVVVVGGGTEGAGGSGEGVTVQVGSEGGEAEAAGEVADAAVEIARIEAERDITIAIVEGENTQAAIAASADAEAQFAERLSNQELEACRIRIAELEGLNTGLTMELQTLRASLTPPPPPASSQENPPEPGLESVAAQDPALVGSPEPAEPPPQKRKLINWI